MGRGNLDYSTEAYREGEGGNRTEDEAADADDEVVCSLIVVEEHVVDVLLSEYDLEDDCYQDEGIGDLICCCLGGYES